MQFKDIIILGPTNSGKTTLANFIASKFDLPVFNCDSVQIYKDLNYLTNKPGFEKQEMTDGEVVSYSKYQETIDEKLYEEFDFHVYIRDKAKAKAKELQISEVLEILNNKPSSSAKATEDMPLTPPFPKEGNLSTSHLVSNYLFDIRSPLRSYSIAEFRSDVDRITKKSNIDSKVIVGGTVYYGYHYLLGTELQLTSYNVQLTTDNEGEIEDLVDFLKKEDPDALDLIDVKNPVRVGKAVEFIRSTGKKYSENYFKEAKLLEDFLLILIYPKDRKSYVEKLGRIVESRINENMLEEIDSLIRKYGDGVKDWLGNISYEYKYGIQIFDKLNELNIQNSELKTKSWKDLSEVKKIIEELKAKERQYTKRQVSFMRKLERDLG